MSFADNATAVGGYAPSWTEVRFTVTPARPVPGVGGGPLTLAGVREFSGGGYTQEGVNTVYASNGTGLAVKITRGRQKPNEVSLKLDPETYRNIWAKVAKAGLFNFQMQLISASGTTSSVETYEGCTDTGLEPQVPNDGSPVEKTVKFMATRYVPPK